MQIAFYSPIKPPDHPVPSGDRTMANLLLAAIRAAGHAAEIASTFRSFSKFPGNNALLSDADREAIRLISRWTDSGAQNRPDLWFTYHPYYKAPDLIGPAVTQALGIPYVTAEASYSSRRQTGEWAAMQSLVIEAVRQASVNICMTPIDREGLSRIVNEDKLADLVPFLDTSQYPENANRERPGKPCQLITVAMMRPGVKIDSYAMLAAALKQLNSTDWQLTIVGDGSARAEVEILFADFPARKLVWLGQQSPDQVREYLLQSDIFVWPGFGEAYGLAYLEAQACGLPVVAQDVEGVPSVVRSGDTGLLTPANDIAAYAKALGTLIADPDLRSTMSMAAHRFVHDDRNLLTAAATIDRVLAQSLSNAPAA